MSTNETYLPASAEQTIQHGILATLKRNKGKFLCTFVVGIALTLTFLAFASRKYRSTSKLFVKQGRETLVLDPTAQTKFSTSNNESQEREVFAVAELMKSRGVIGQVVDHFGPKVVLEKDPGDKFLGEHLTFLDDANLNPLRVYSVRDKAIEAFSENMSVVAGKKTNVVTVQYDSDSPQMAKDVLDHWVRVAIEEHMRIHRTRGSEEYFEAKVVSAEKLVDELDAKLRDLKTESGLAELNKQRDTLLNMIGELRLSILKNQAVEKSVQAGLDERISSLKTIPEMITIEQATDQPQAVGQSYREQLLELEVREQELSTRFSDDHVKVKQIRKQIAEVRAIVDKESVLTETKIGVNRLHQDKTSEVLIYQSRLVEIQAELQITQENLTQLNQQLALINNSEQKLNKLEMEIDLAREDYRTYHENLEQARINNELEQKKITSLNLMESPTFVETPVFPNPKVTLAAGGILAIMASMCVAIFFDKKNRLPVSNRVNNESLVQDRNLDSNVLESRIPVPVGIGEASRGNGTVSESSSAVTAARIKEVRRTPR